MVVAVGLFLAVMSTTMVSVALPSIGTALHASPTELEWIVDAYVIVYSALLVPVAQRATVSGARACSWPG
jgi:DHA2 family methylenomycin A resistance protein-like MFS transporter